jgi:hypothetical protein
MQTPVGRAPVPAAILARCCREPRMRITGAGFGPRRIIPPIMEFLPGSGYNGPRSYCKTRFFYHPERSEGSR